MNYTQKPSLKGESASLTNHYLRMLFEEVKVDEQGCDAKVSDINLINHIRADVNLADEAIKRQLRSKVRRDAEPDPDADCP